MNNNSRFYIVLPNVDSESWTRWVWTDVENISELYLNNSSLKSGFLCQLKKIHYSNKANKRLWLPFKCVWDRSFPIKARMLENKYNNYIIFQSGIKCSPHYIHRLKKECNAQIILFLPDTLAGLSIAHNEKEWVRYKDYYCVDQVYSFDLNDCKRYNFNFFDFYSITHKLPESTKIEIDLFYIGNCRSPLRLEQVRSIYSRAKINMSCNFRIVGVPDQEVKEMDGIIYNQSLSYSEVVTQNQRSRCILELINSGQHGNTLRFKEAICYNRKLLTNNPAVLQSKYYNPRWIQYFEHPEDINFDWILNNDMPDYKYGGEYSPLLLLEMIEKNNI